jgi:glutamyl-tRNA synthetase
LRTAYISHAWARALGIPWVVRFEDIDTPRVVAGAREAQTADMLALGLRADQVFLQTESRDRHWNWFCRAVDQGQVYPCFCSRKEVAEALRTAASAPHHPEAIYDGHCRPGSGGKNANRGTGAATLAGIAWRFRGSDPQGSMDFIVARTGSHPVLAAGSAACGFVPAYHWACAIDDYECAGSPYDLLVRAADLRSATIHQRTIQKWLVRELEQAPEYPAVFHCALVTGPGGERLEKRTRGVTLPELIAGGLSATAVAAKLATSFAPDPDEFEPAKIWGEARPALTLTELGF